MIENRIRIWKMGYLESHRRGLSLRNRWHFQCRTCNSCGTIDGHPSSLAAEIAAQDHINERHSDD